MKKSEKTRAEEFKKHFSNAYLNHLPVFDTIDRMIEKYPPGSTESFQENWTNPLELYSVYLNELIDDGANLHEELEGTQWAVDIYGVE